MDDSRRRKRVFKTAAVNPAGMLLKIVVDALFYKAAYSHVVKYFIYPAAGPRWTKTEDALLESSVNELGEDFPSIAERFNGTRTEAQCQHRWSKVLQPGFVKGPWQPEEDEVSSRSIAKASVHTTRMRVTVFGSSNSDNVQLLNCNQN